MHRRRLTNGLNPKQVHELTRGWQHAARINRPLNVMVTIKPFEERDRHTACKLAAAIQDGPAV